MLNLNLVSVFWFVVWILSFYPKNCDKFALFFAIPTNLTLLNHDVEGEDTIVQV